jgi:DeoR/GlpR family transcriptional regulator of sugar metabolism
MHDKIGTAEPYKVCPINSLHTIVTEIEPDAAMFKPYVERGIQVL